jgi:hypothetical protein
LNQYGDFVVSLMKGMGKRQGWEQWKGALAYALHGSLVVEGGQIRADPVPVYRGWRDPPGELEGVGIYMKESRSHSS